MVLCYYSYTHMNIFSRFSCILDRIKYDRGKHLYLAVFIFMAILLLVFTILFFKVKSEIRTKENILKSYVKNPDTESSPNNALIKVYICGEIKNPGVYEVKEGSRINAVIKAAGGMTENAATSMINPAKKAEDEQKIYIPSIKEEAAGNGLVNINYASAADLEKLPGIGPVTAENIIAYRDKNGEFGKKEDLKKINGIGDSKYQNIKELISI